MHPEAERKLDEQAAKLLGELLEEASFVVLCVLMLVAGTLFGSWMADW